MLPGKMKIMLLVLGVCSFAITAHAQTPSEGTASELYAKAMRNRPALPSKPAVSASEGKSKLPSAQRAIHPPKTKGPGVVPGAVSNEEGRRNLRSNANVTGEQATKRRRVVPPAVPPAE